MPPNIEKILLRSESFLKEYDIDIRKKSKVVSIDANTKSVTLEDGKIIVKFKILNQTTINY